MFKPLNNSDLYSSRPGIPHLEWVDFRQGQRAHGWGIPGREEYTLGACRT